jgi:hypothetical protein
MRSGTQDMRSLCRTGPHTTAVRELGRYKLDLVGVLEDRWEKGGTARTANFTFFYAKDIKNHQLGAGLFVHQRIVRAVKRVGCVNDKMLYTELRGHWCNIIALNVHALTKKKNDDTSTI